MIEDFRTLCDEGRATYARCISKSAALERVQRIEHNATGLRLVGGAS